MNIFERIKINIFQTKLKEIGTRLRRPVRTVTNLDDAQNIGIIYDSSDYDNDITITKFAEMLRNKGKKVEVLAYTKERNIDHKADVILINRRKTRWFGLPEDERVQAWCEKPFDLLICAMLKANNPLEYIAYLSKAKYRIGPYDKDRTWCFDLMVMTEANTGMDTLLQRMVNLLGKLKHG